MTSPAMTGPALFQTSVQAPAGRLIGRATLVFLGVVISVLTAQCWRLWVGDGWGADLAGAVAFALEQFVCMAAARVEPTGRCDMRLRDLPPLPAPSAPPPREPSVELVAVELAGYDAVADIINRQVKSSVDETEAAALAIVTRLGDLDAGVHDLLAALVRTSPSRLPCRRPSARISGRLNLH